MKHSSRIFLYGFFTVLEIWAAFTTDHEFFRALFIVFAILFAVQFLWVLCFEPRLEMEISVNSKPQAPPYDWEKDEL